MAKRGQGKLNAALEEAIAGEVKEISRRHAEDVIEETEEGEGDDKKTVETVVAKKGDFVYPTLERMRVYDRALKLEQIKVRLDGDEWGGKFGKNGATDEK